MGFVGFRCVPQNSGFVVCVGNDCIQLQKCIGLSIIACCWHVMVFGILSAEKIGICGVWN